MSFSVKETDFLPYDEARRGMDAASISSSAMMPALIDKTGKPRVCVAYYETGQCPYHNRCEHAHHFTELDRSTQEKLLETVPMENIPRHFITSLHHTHSHLSLNNSQNININNTTASKRKTLVQHRRGRRGVPPHDMSGSNLCDNSFSSLASSTDSFFLGSVIDSKDVSPRKAVARREDNSITNITATEPFRIRLPPRCRYPHREIRGTYYDVLGVPRGATHDDILAGYNRWQKEYRRAKIIDQQRADAHDSVVVEARNVLGHPILRVEYDRTLPSLWSMSSNNNIHNMSNIHNNSREFIRGTGSNIGTFTTTTTTAAAATAMAATTGTATAISSVNSSRSMNIDTPSAYTNAMRAVKSSNVVDIIPLSVTSGLCDSIW